MRSAWIKWGLFGVATCATSALGSPARAEEPVCVDVSLWEGFEWLYYSFSPNQDNPSGLSPIAPSADLVPPAERDPSSEKRIVLFGDLLPMQADTPPRVHNELRALFASADLVVGNIESPVYRSVVDLDADQTGDFHASTGFVKSFMAQYCVDPDKAVFSIANNHAGDRGMTGFQETVAATDSLGVRGVVGKPQADGSVVGVYDLGGLRVGVVAWTQVENCPLNDAWVRLSDVQAVDWAEVKQTEAIDFLMGSPHWENQFHYFPQSETRALASLLHEDGFDLLAGHHPTVMQPAELLEDGMAFYSLGSLNANYSFNGRTQLVSVTEIIVDAQGRIVRYQVHPYAQRKVNTTLPAINLCPDGRVVFDVPRSTDWEVVPLQEISNFWGTRSVLEGRFEVVFSD